jgi:SPP1 family predicted phage head-tail adaptor
MKAGQLRHYITVQQVTETQDTFGQGIESWTTWKQVYAAVEPMVGREYFASAQTLSKVTHRIRIRHLSGLTTKHRISWDGRIFDIESVINVMERERELVLMCVERVD